MRSIELQKFGGPGVAHMTSELIPIHLCSVAWIQHIPSSLERKFSCETRRQMNWALQAHSCGSESVYSHSGAFQGLSHTLGGPVESCT